MNKFSIRCYSRLVDVYLIKNNTGLGKPGEIVSVKPGTARNSLIPKKLAIYVGEDEFKRDLPILHFRNEDAELQLTQKMIQNEVRKWLNYVPRQAMVSLNTNGSSFNSSPQTSKSTILNTEMNSRTQKKDIPLTDPLELPEGRKKFAQGR